MRTHRGSGGMHSERESATFLWAVWTLSSNLLCLYSSAPWAEILGYKVVHTSIEQTLGTTSVIVFLVSPSYSQDTLFLKSHLRLFILFLTTGQLCSSESLITLIIIDIKSFLVIARMWDCL